MQGPTRGCETALSWKGFLSVITRTAAWQAAEQDSWGVAKIGTVPPEVSSSVQNAWRLIGRDSSGSRNRYLKYCSLPKCPRLAGRAVQGFLRKCQRPTDCESIRPGEGVQDRFLPWAS